MIEITKVKEIYDKQFEDSVKREVSRIVSDPSNNFFEKYSSQYISQLEDLESGDDEKVSTAANFFASKIIRNADLDEKAFEVLAEIITASYDSIRKIGLRKESEKTIPLIAMLLRLPYFEISEELSKRLIQIGKSLEGGVSYGKEEAVLTKKQAKEFKMAFGYNSRQDRNSCKDLRYYILKNYRYQDYADVLIYDFYDDISTIRDMMEKLTTCIAISLDTLNFSNLATICGCNYFLDWPLNCKYSYMIRNAGEIEKWLGISKRASKDDRWSELRMLNMPEEFMGIQPYPSRNEVWEDLQILKELNSIKKLKERFEVIRKN